MSFLGNRHLSKKYTVQRICFQCRLEFKGKDYAASKEDGKDKIILEKQLKRDKERRKIG